MRLMITCSAVDSSTGGCHRGGRMGRPPFETARRWWSPMLSPHGKILDRCSRTCTRRGGLLAPRPCLCYPCLPPGPAAHFTTCALGHAEDAAPRLPLPLAPAGRQDDGCPVQATSPSGSLQTRAGPGPGGRVRLPPASRVPCACNDSPVTGKVPVDGHAPDPDVPARLPAPAV